MSRKSENKTVLCVTVDKEVKEYLEEMAKKDHSTLSAFVNRWFVTYMTELDEEEYTVADHLINKLF